MTAALTKNGKDFLRLIRADEVIRENALYALYAFLNNLRIIRAAILSQKKFKDIDRNICPFLDFLGQILAYNLSIKILTQF